MDVTPRHLVAFDLVTGNRLARVPGQFDYEEEVNEYGLITVTSQWSQEAADLRTWERTRPMRTIIAVMQGAEVICAGPITDRDPQRDNFQLNAAASFWRFFEERLALNPVLQTMFQNGEVLVDEENPSPEWILNFSGSFVDIAADLVDVALAWGTLPVTAPAREGGFQTRNYRGWEFATIASRLQLLTGVLGGPELRFKPRIRVDGGIWFDLQGAPELIDNVHSWNAAVPESGVTLIRVPEDASRLATDAWAFGGRSEDIVIAARARSTTLTDQGWPVMQKALTGLDSVTEVTTLEGHVQERIIRSNVEPGVFEFKVGVEKNVRPGDWANVRIDDPAYGQGVIPLKILRVEGNGLSDYVSVFGRRRTDGL